MGKIVTETKRREHFWEGAIYSSNAGKLVKRRTENCQLLLQVGRYKYDVCEVIGRKPNWSRLRNKCKVKK